MRNVVFPSAVLALALAAPPAHAIPQYALTDLGPELAAELKFWATVGDGLRIGPDGTVAAAAGGKLLVHSGGTLRTITPPPGHQIQRVTDINGKGDILLYAFDTAKSHAGAAVFSDGQFFELGSPDSITAYAYRINDNGTAIGYERPVGYSNPIPVLMTRGASIPLDGAPANGFGTAINNAGVVAGATSQQLEAAPFILDGDATYLPPGLTGQYFSFVHDINDSGTAVGWTAPWNGPTLPFVVDRNGAEFIDIPPAAFGGVPYAINADGFIVGALAGPGQGAFVSYQNSTHLLSNLLATGITQDLSVAMDINDSGQIVASGRVECRSCLGFSEEHAFLLTPVPEPSTWLLAGAGLCFTGLRRYRLRIAART